MNKGWEEKWDGFSKEEIRKELDEEFNRQAAYRDIMHHKPSDEPSTTVWDKPELLRWGDQADVDFYVPGKDEVYHSIRIYCTKHFVNDQLTEAIKAMFPGAVIGSRAHSMLRVNDQNEWRHMP